MRSPTFTRPRADCFVRSVTDAPVRERKTGALTGAQQWHLPLSWRRQRHLKRVPLRSALPVLFCKREEDGDERPRPRKTPPQRSVDSGSRAPNPSEVRQVRSDLLSWDFLAIWMHSLVGHARATPLAAKLCRCHPLSAGCAIRLACGGVTYRLVTRIRRMGCFLAAIAAALSLILVSLFAALTQMSKSEFDAAARRSRMPVEPQLIHGVGVFRSMG